jgi:hypothetical protein
MKSIEITKEGWAGIPADAVAFTKADEVSWVDTKDIQCLGPVVATLKGIRAAFPATSIAIKGPDGENVTASTELSVTGEESLVVHVVYDPVYSSYPITWTSSDKTKVKVTAIDTYSALVEPVVADAGDITITATAQAGKTATATFKAVA